jgi:hypothetical protein
MESVSSKWRVEMDESIIQEVMTKKKVVVSLESIDFSKLISLANLLVLANNQGTKILVSAPKKVALSLSFIGFDAFVEVVAQ